MKQLLKSAAMSILAVLTITSLATPVYANCGVSGGIGSGAKCSKGEGQKDDLFGTNGIFTTITNTLLFLIGAVSVIMIIYAGIQYATSGGDSGKVTSAKNTILYAVVGIVVAVLAYAIVNFVVSSMAGTATPSGLIRLF